jgi:hypothetical protein
LEVNSYRIHQMCSTESTIASEVVLIFLDIEGLPEETMGVIPECVHIITCLLSALELEGVPEANVKLVGIRWTSNAEVSSCYISIAPNVRIS